MEYDHITAFHYAAYRPLLHQEILKDCLEDKNGDRLGLDVGCGTGHSAIALAEYCGEVIGVEPSKEMLVKSINHPQVEYRHSDGRKLDFPEGYFDVISFAGSLHYAKSQQLLDEVIRVGKDNSKIVIYDFEILLDIILEKLDLDIRQRQQSDYDHEVNFDGLSQKYIAIEKHLKKFMTINISVENVAHLLLSSKDNFHLLVNAFGTENLHAKISQELQSLFPSGSIPVKANTCSMVYRIIK